MERSDEDWEKYILEAKRRPLLFEQILSLTERLANSGHRIVGKIDNSIDIASTGGPSSLTTLLCPFYLQAEGRLVVKLGVPGRPAGGLDIMSQIPGYSIDLSIDDMHQVLAECGFAHFRSNGLFAPEDARSFQIRKKVDGLAVPELAIASLLSKKVALGLETVGLDVRIAPHGNFGADWAQARANSSVFVRAAMEFGINAKCFLTDATVPYQPFIGRGEAIWALYTIISGNPDDSLMIHERLCKQLSAEFSKVENEIEITSLVNAIHTHVRAQGGDPDAIEEIAVETEQGHSYEITAKRDRMDQNRLRKAAVSCHEIPGDSNQ